jgi:hypothetical protein
MHDIDLTRETFEGENDEYSGEYSFEADDRETALAEELLSLESDAELDQFLGELAGGRSGSRFRKIGRVLKPLAKKVLPIAGKIAGSYFGPIGGKIGGKLGSLAANLFELEGLEPQEAEVEAARRFVRLAQDAFDRAAAQPAAMPSDQAARESLVAAARSHAPGLLRPGRGPAGRRPGCSRPRGCSGRWERRGKTIVVLGA